MPDVFIQDSRYAVRSLWKSRGFSAVAILTLGLGIGANTALFSLVDALFLRSLPVQAPDRLVNVVRMDSATGKLVALDRSAFDGVRQLRTVFTDAAGSVTLGRSETAIDGAAEPGRLILRATANFFQVLGVDAAIGRADSPSHAAVISDRFWKARFQANPNVLGRVLTVDGQAYPIIGVAPPAFLGTSLDASGDVWLLSPEFVPITAIARLQPGVEGGQALAAASALFQHVDEEQGRSDGSTPPPRTDITPAGQGSSALRNQYRGSLLALMSLVVLVLLITCANIGTLLVVRNTRRARELTVRTALGAKRSRLIAQLLVESIVLAILGSGAALLVAKWGVSALLATLPLAEIPQPLVFRADTRVLAFMGTVSMLSALLFALAPAWRATRVDPGAALKSAQATATPRGTRRLSQWLVAGQIALSIVLLTGAVLFVQTVRNVARLNLGFDSRNLLQVELADRTVRYRPEDARGIHERLLAEVSAVPGVEAVTLVNPLFPSWAVGVPQPAGEAGYAVGPGFFELMRIPLVRGRLFTPEDLTRPEGVIIANEAFAREAFPGEDAIGKRAGFSHAEIVGVVADTKLTNVRWNETHLYRLALRDARLMPGMIVRITVAPDRVIRPIQQAVLRVNPRLLLSVRTVDDVINRSIARERMVAGTSAFFASLGLVLAGIGVFGVAAFAVADRTRELGLRIALGASPWDVIRESLQGTVRVLSVGLATGIIAAAAGTRLAGSLISGLLFGLTPTDWTQIAMASAVMLAIAVAACLVPAFRATRVDPLEAIRYE